MKKMRVKRLLVDNFRNCQKGDWFFSGGINVLYGHNGEGKTNVIESLYFSALGCSHRTFQEDDLINSAADGMGVCVVAEKEDGGETKIVIKKSARRKSKEITVDNSKVKPRELIGQIKAAIFSPEDLKLAKSEPALRRRFIDMQIAQVNSAYCFSLARYNKILQQRNKLLAAIKERKMSVNLLEVWDDQLAKEASLILPARLKTLLKISRLTAEVYGELSGRREKAGMVYCRREDGSSEFVGEDAENSYCWYKKGLAARIKKDTENASTGLGPHRDDIFFTLDGLPLKNFASQGQQRSFVLALKIAETMIIRDECGEYPILLLDDALSELDARRRQKLIDFLSGRIQTFITLTEKNLFKDFGRAVFYRVEKGVVSEA
ncbi:MAG: DNA replication/repair protein RecF [Acidaminococcales bacterium]|jgi:DNA replication and repair protein RecF|nr:DNA replication/repair protein RecF [Acidaminococcales bacterium]